MYQEVYSECTCWYCETIRSSHISSIGKALGLSMNDTSKYEAKSLNLSTYFVLANSLQSLIDFMSRGLPNNAPQTIRRTSLRTTP